MIVLYHAGCNDGFAAALIARRKYPDARFKVVHYGDVPPELAGEDVLILDFCFERSVMEAISKAAKMVFVIDHHKTAKDVVLEFGGVFDNSKSGAMLTWEYFFPNEPVPNWVKYIQDYDLWQFKLPNSREWSAGLNLYPRDFDQWEVFFTGTPSDNFLIGKGETVLEYQRTLVDQIINHTILRNILGYMVPCVNTNVLIDLCGERMCQGYPFSASYYDRADGKRKWSLRSAADGSGIDVGELAKTIPGGGGHKNAAGFETINPDVIEMKHE